MTIVENPRYMTRAELLDEYSGHYVALLQKDESLFSEGVAVAYGENSGKSWEELYSYLDKEYGAGAGFVHLAKREEFEDNLYVIFRDVR